MKYENYQAVIDLVKQIDKKAQFLEQLRSDSISVDINIGNMHVMNIGTWKDCEHSHRDLAEKFRKSLHDKVASELYHLHEKLALL